MGLNGHTQLDRIVRRMNQILLRAQISLGSLNGGVAQQHLDLLQFPAGSAAQLRAGTAQVMRRDTGNANLGRVPPEHLPDDLLAQAVAGNAAGRFTGRNT